MPEKILKSDVLFNNLNIAQNVKKYRQNSHRIVIGNKEMMDEENIDIPAFQESGPAVGRLIPVYFAVDGKLTAKISMAEELENYSAQMIKRLKESGISDISIISGDLKSNTRSIAEKLNISDYEGNLSVTEKQKFIYGKKRKGTVIIAGDGINDSLAMKEADISISFLNGASVEALLKSDCILLEKNMLLIPELIDMTEQSYYRIQRNIDFCKAYNIAFGALAMLGYYGPFSAQSMNTVNSILAVMNSSRISSRPIKLKNNRNEVKL